MRGRNVLNAFLAVVLAGMAFKAPARAVSFTELPVDGTWLEAELESGSTAAYYTLTLPSDGYLDVNLQSEMYTVNCAVLDLDLIDSYADNSLWYGSTAEPVTGQTGSVLLAKGTYCVKIYGPDWNTERGEKGIYRLCAEFDPVETTEEEPNDNIEEAMRLSSGKKQAGIVWQDDEYDYYRFSVFSAGTVEILVNSYTHELEVGLRDEFQVDVFGKETIWYGNLSEPTAYRKTIELQPGDYYLFCARRDSGYYDVMVTGDVLEQSAGVPLAAGQNTQSAGVSAAAGQNTSEINAPSSSEVTLQVQGAMQLAAIGDGDVVWGSNNTAIAAVSSTGVVVGVSEGTAQIVGVALDGTGAMTTYTVHVVK